MHAGGGAGAAVLAVRDAERRGGGVSVLHDVRTGAGAPQTHRHVVHAAARVHGLDGHAPDTPLARGKIYNICVHPIAMYAYIYMYVRLEGLMFMMLHCV